jgi:hypothetical protein
MLPHDPHFHDCPHCDGKASIPAPGRSAYKCTRCGKVTSEAELRRISMRRTPAGTIRDERASGASEDSPIADIGTETFNSRFDGGGS